ncbi:MAG: HTH domain-containing protein [Candidatus Bathyarchaeia archaeon]
MAKLTDIFMSKAQVKLIEYLLNNKDKVFNQSFLATTLNLSPSTIARVIEPLARLGLIKYERFGGGMKILCLNTEDPVAKALLELNERLQRL